MNALKAFISNSVYSRIAAGEGTADVPSKKDLHIMIFFIEIQMVWHIIGRCSTKGEEQKIYV